MLTNLTQLQVHKGTLATTLSHSRHLGLLGLGDRGRGNSARACVLDVLDGRKPIAEEGGVVSVPHTVFLAHLTHGRLDVGVPGARHAGEAMVFNLEVEATSQVARDLATVC